MFRWVQDLMLNETLLKVQPSDGSIETEPKHVVVRYDVKYIF